MWNLKKVLAHFLWVHLVFGKPTLAIGAISTDVLKWPNNKLLIWPSGHTEQRARWKEKMNSWTALPIVNKNWKVNNLYLIISIGVTMFGEVSCDLLKFENEKIPFESLRKMLEREWDVKFS